MYELVMRRNADSLNGSLTNYSVLISVIINYKLGKMSLVRKKLGNTS